METKTPKPVVTLRHLQQVDIPSRTIEDLTLLLPFFSRAIDSDGARIPVPSECLDLKIGLGIEFGAVSPDEIDLVSSMSTLDPGTGPVRREPVRLTILVNKSTAYLGLSVTVPAPVLPGITQQTLKDHKAHRVSLWLSEQTRRLTVTLFTPALEKVIFPKHLTKVDREKIPAAEREKELTGALIAALALYRKELLRAANLYCDIDTYLKGARDSE